MEERKVFKFYKSYYDVFVELNDADKVAFINALFERQFYGREPELTGMAKFAYISQKHSIDAQVLGYETKVGKLQDPTQGGAVGGMQGGAVTPALQKKEEKKKKEEYTNRGFEKPTLDQIKKYCQERSNNVDPSKWFDFYQSKGWMIGKNKMKDWKAAVRTWEGKSQVNDARIQTRKRLD